MTRQQAAKRLHALIDEFIADQEFDYEEFADWVSELQDWLENTPSKWQT